MLIMNCKYCHSENVIKYGKYKDVQRYFCKDCKRKFAGIDTIPKMQYPTSQVSDVLAIKRILRLKKGGSMDNTIRNLIPWEKQTLEETVKRHGREFELLATMLNLYTNGTNLIGNLNDDASDTSKLWLRIIARSYQSLRMSIDLMKKAYYAQAMALIRMVTESYFICGNCKADQSIVDAILYEKPNMSNGKIRFNFKELAKNMDALVMWEKDYDFECKFVHCSKLSMDIMTKRIGDKNLELQIVPTYEEQLFDFCCQFALKNGRLMSQFIYELLTDLSEEKANAWLIKSTKGINEIDEWLDNLKQKYGSE